MQSCTYLSEVDTGGQRGGVVWALFRSLPHGSVMHLPQRRGSPNQHMTACPGYGTGCNGGKKRRKNEEKKHLGPVRTVMSAFRPRICTDENGTCFAIAERTTTVQKQPMRRFSFCGSRKKTRIGPMITGWDGFARRRREKNWVLCVAWDPAVRLSRSHFHGMGWAPLVVDYVGCEWDGKLWCSLNDGTTWEPTKSKADG